MDVAVLGVSANPQRYAYKAMQELKARGHHPIGINPHLSKTSQFDVVATIAELPANVHTLTLYVGPERSTTLAEAILGYGFERVIFNPGSENAELAGRLRLRKTEVIEACTLVMLKTGQF
jgi:predicted CoA-binding protein